MSDFQDPRHIERGLNGTLAGNPAYSAFSAAYASYATPTDMAALRNPAASGKILLVRLFTMLSNSTAASLVTYFWYKRAALNTNGTPTNLTPVPYDSRDPAAVAVPRTYGAAPTITDGAAPLIAYAKGLTNATASAGPAQLSMITQGIGLVVNVNVDLGKPLAILQGEELAVNFGGAVLPVGGGYTAIAGFQWAEVDANTAF